MEPTQVKQNSRCKNCCNILWLIVSFFFGVKKSDNKDVIVKKLLMVTAAVIVIGFQLLAITTQNRNVIMFIIAGCLLATASVFYILFVIFKYRWILSLAFLLLNSVLLISSQVFNKGKGILNNASMRGFGLPMVFSAGLASSPIATLVAVAIYVLYNAFYFVADVFFGFTPIESTVSKTGSPSTLLQYILVVIPLFFGIFMIAQSIISQKSLNILKELCLFILKDRGPDVSAYKLLRKIKVGMASSKFHLGIRNAVLSVEDLFSSSFAEDYFEGEEADSFSSLERNISDVVSNVSAHSDGSKNSKNSKDSSENHSSSAEGTGTTTTRSSGSGSGRKRVSKKPKKSFFGILREKKKTKNKMLYRMKMCVHVLIEFPENINKDKASCIFIKKKRKEYKFQYISNDSTIAVLIFVDNTDMNSRKVITDALDFTIEFRAFLERRAVPWRNVLVRQFEGKSGYQIYADKRQLVHCAREIAHTKHVFRCMLKTGKTDYLMLLKPVDDDLTSSSTITVTYDYTGVDHDGVIDFGVDKHGNKVLVSCYNVKKMKKKIVESGGEWSSNVPEDVLNTTSKERILEAKNEMWKYSKDINFFEKAQEKDNIVVKSI